jgi:RNA polymerase sigma-70 factor (ECF subfamily)
LQCAASVRAQICLIARIEPHTTTGGSSRRAVGTFSELFPARAVYSGVNTAGVLLINLPTGTDTGDLSLVRRVQKGDKAAFDALVLKYQHKVLKLVQRYVRDPSEAEDVVQDAFIKAYRALPAFRGDSAFYTWLYRIAINTAKNALVSAGRRPMSFDLDAQDATGAEFQARLKDTDTPERLLLTEEIRSTVNKAIDGLPDDLRTAIVLRELEGLSYEEIAHTMDCPVGTVRSRIFRAREAIDRHLKGVFEGGLGRDGEDA